MIYYKGIVREKEMANNSLTESGYTSCLERRGGTSGNSACNASSLAGNELFGF